MPKAPSTGLVALTFWKLVPTFLNNVTVIDWPGCAVNSSPEAVMSAPAETFKVV